MKRGSVKEQFHVKYAAVTVSILGNQGSTYYSISGLACFKIRVWESISKSVEVY